MSLLAARHTLSMRSPADSDVLGHRAFVPIKPRGREGLHELFGRNDSSTAP